MCWTKNIALKLHPTLEESKELLSKGIAKKSFLMMVAECRVDYQGRSSSTLDWGERLIMVKADGVVLVHQPSGYEAVNWQPPGCILSAARDGDSLMLRAARHAPREVLSVTFKDIYLITFMKMADAAKIEMLLSENELYGAVSAHPELIEPGFRIAASQRGFKKGVADFTGMDREGRYVVLEVKRNSANTDAVKQLYKYVSEIRLSRPSIRGILAAPGISSEARMLAKSLRLDYAALNLKRCTDLLSRKRKTLTGKLDSHF